MEEESSLILMATYTKVNGRKTKPMDTELFFKHTVLNMSAVGKTVCIMALDSIRGLMAPNMRVDTMKTRRMGREHLRGQMAQATGVNGT